MIRRLIVSSALVAGFATFAAPSDAAAGGFTAAQASRGASGYASQCSQCHGAQLWSYNLGAGVNAPPVTYQVGGQQYIAVAAGGNFQLDYALGDAIAIFKLPTPAAK
jgi:glucose dehydrogenase